MGTGTNVLVRISLDTAKVRAGAESSTAQPPTDLPAHAARGGKNQLFFLCSVSGTLCLQGLGTHWPGEQ